MSIDPLDRVLAFALKTRWLVLCAVAAMAAFGAWNFTRLPIDAVPDITTVQVQVNTSVEGLAPGTSYVVKNAFLLKAELGKSEAGHDH